MVRSKVIVSMAAGCLAVLVGAGFVTSAHAADSVSDSQLTGRVKGKLAVDDPQVAGLIQVSAKDGIITLSGTTYTGQQVLKVLKDAQSVAGVVKVQNRMSVEQ